MNDPLTISPPLPLPLCQYVTGSGSEVPEGEAQQAQKGEEIDPHQDEENVVLEPRGGDTRTRHVCVCVCVCG